ncbi:MAG: prepilin-type N-terminal cleavage/methylation domain-containing protein [Chthoniobacter sp.]|uniref:type II secretion system protein n=1 Tax=Chthoniobacter sp. TaxID=2510640 RepID=UPI0032A67648
MIRTAPHRAFTLIEMITVIAIIAILAALVLGVYQVVKYQTAKARADTDIQQLSSALQSYHTDYGGFPQDSQKTDKLDARNVSDATDGSPTGKMAAASKYLYECLTGDTSDNGTMTKNYAPGFFIPSRLGGPKVGNTVNPVQYIMDPFGNSYGYSTAGLLVEQEYRAALATNPNANRPVQNSQGTQGYNPTFDLWSTAGDTTGNTAKWRKNW